MEEVKEMLERSGLKIEDDSKLVTMVRTKLWKHWVKKVESEEIASQLALYIPTELGATEKDEIDKRFDGKCDVHQFLFDSESQLMLLLGDSGAGKSLFGQWLVDDLWNNSRKFAPIFIHLPSIKIKKGFLEKYLNKTCELSEKEINILRSYGSLFLILDSYDEMVSENIGKNLHRIGKLYNWNVKVLISCRTEALVRYSKKEQLSMFATYNKIDGKWHKNENFLKRYVQFFDPKTQIPQYVRKWKIQNHDQVDRELNYLEVMHSLPGLAEMITNPFILMIVMPALPRLLNLYLNKPELERFDLTRLDLYQEFTEAWFERQRKKLVDNETINDLWAATIVNDFRNYCEQLANKMYQYNIDRVMYDPANTSDKDEWEIFFKADGFYNEDPNKSLKLIRQGALLRISDGTTYTFLHKSLLEYFAATKVFRSAANTVSIALGLEINSQLFTRYPTIVRFGVDCISQNPTFEKSLWDILEESKHEPRVAIAASNAITILNAANRSFAGKDFSRVRIRGANVSGGNFDGTDLQESDVRDVDFSRAWLTRSNFSGSCVDNIRIAGLQGQKLDSEVRGCLFSSTGQYYVVVSDTKLYIYQTDTHECIFFDFVDIHPYRLAEFKLYQFISNQLYFYHYYESLTFTIEFNDKKITKTEIKKIEDNTTVIDKFRGYIYLHTNNLLTENEIDCFVEKNESNLAHLGLTIEDFEGFIDQKINSIAKILKPVLLVWLRDAQVLAFIKDKILEKRLTTIGENIEDLNRLIFDPNVIKLFIRDFDCGFRYNLIDPEYRNRLKNYCPIPHELNGQPDFQNRLGYSFLIYDTFLLLAQILNKTIYIWEDKNPRDNCINTGDGYFVRYYDDAVEQVTVIRDKNENNQEIWVLDDAVDDKRESQKPMLTNHAYTMRYIHPEPAERIDLFFDLPDKNDFGLHQQKFYLIRRFIGFEQQNPSEEYSHFRLSVKKPFFEKTPFYKLLEKCLALVQDNTHNKLLIHHREKGILLFDLQSQEERIIDTNAKPSDVNSMIFSHDGRFILVGLSDGTIRRWDTVSGECLSTWMAHLVSSISISKDGTWALSGSMDGTIKYWDISKNECIATWTGHTDRITTIEISPDETWALSGSVDGSIKRWEIGVQQLLLGSGHEKPVTGLHLSINNSWVISESKDDTFKRWTNYNGRCMQTVTGSLNRDYRTKWNIIPSEEKNFTRWSAIWYAHNESPVCNYIHSDEWALTGSSNGMIKYWKSSKTLSVVNWAGHSSAVTAFTSNTKGTLVFSGDNNGKLLLWSVNTGELIGTCAILNPISCLKWVTNKGDYLFSGMSDGSICSWRFDAKRIKIYLLWRTRPWLLQANNCSLLGVYGLTAEQKEDFESKGARVQISSKSSEYIINKREKEMINHDPNHTITSIFDPSLIISPEAWVISIVRKRTWDKSNEKNDPRQHAFLLLESVENGIYRLRRIDFLLEHRHRFLPQDSGSGTKIGVFGQGLIEISDKSLDDIVKLVPLCCALSQGILPIQGLKLMENIREAQSKTIGYCLTGAGNIYKMFRMKEAEAHHNCMSWCEEQLQLINIKLTEQSWKDGVVNDPRLKIRDTHSEPGIPQDTNDDEFTTGERCITM